MAELSPEDLLRTVIDKARGRDASSAFCFGCHVVDNAHLMVHEDGPGYVRAYARTERHVEGIAAVARLRRELLLREAPLRFDRPGDITFRVPS